MHGHSAIDAGSDTHTSIPKGIVYKHLLSTIYDQRMQNGFSEEISKEEIGAIFQRECFQLWQYILAYYQSKTEISTKKLKETFWNVYDKKGVKEFLRKSKTLSILENSPDKIYVMWEYIEEQMYGRSHTPEKIIQETKPISPDFIKNLIESIRAHGLGIHQDHVIDIIELINWLDPTSQEEIQDVFASAFRNSYTRSDKYRYPHIEQPQIWLEHFCLLASKIIWVSDKKYYQKEVYAALLLYIWYQENAAMYAQQIFPPHSEQVRQTSEAVREIIDRMNKGDFSKAVEMAATLSSETKNT